MPRWLTRGMVLALHDEQLERFGGGRGLRDEGLLDSALARAKNRHAYEPNATLFQLAADYGYGIVRNHPFVDGNKRTGVISVAVFLSLNGYAFDPDQMDEVRTILALAAGEVDEEDLARWIAANCTPIEA